MARSGQGAVRVLRVLAGAGLLLLGVVGVLNLANPDGEPSTRAVVVMGLGLVVVWCILGGVAMRLGRDRLVALVGRPKIPWPMTFVLLGVVMVLLEEAVATSMTNAAPLLSTTTEAAHITASANYIEVVLGRVVDGEFQAGTAVIFLPWLICWAWMLKRWDFKPAEVVLLFGLTGTIAETVTFGLQNLAGVCMWVYVYGLMVYVPACAVPADRPVRPPPWWLWPVAVLLPLVFVIPLAAWLLVMAVWRPICFVRRRRIGRKPLLPTRYENYRPFSQPGVSVNCDSRKSSTD